MNSREHQSLGLAQLIRESVQTYHKRALAAGIDIRIVNDFVFDIELLADLRELKDLFGKVIQNTIDHTGATTITFYTRQLLYFENHVLLEFCVSDNGTSGKRSFAYYRSLVQIRQLVEELHGKSESTVVPGISSSLKFIIKARWRYPDSLLALLNKENPHKKLIECRVLVVDANEINQLSLKQVLQKEGAVVETASEGIEAIRMLELHSYDLLLLDLNLQHMDGFQTANYIRKKLRNNIPIIALSAEADSLEVLLQCHDAGFRKLLKKPLDCLTLDSLNMEHLKGDCLKLDLGRLDKLMGKETSLIVPHSYKEFSSLKDKEQFIISDMLNADLYIKKTIE